MNIAVIGSGNVGSALGACWSAHGHQISFGVRNSHSDSARNAAARVPAARMTNIESAAAHATVVLLAVPADAVLSTVSRLGPLDGTVIIDAVNWFGAKPAGVDQSIAEAVAAAAPGAQVVKAFNSTGTDNMLNPQFGDLRADMFIAGDHVGAKQIVAELAGGIGFDVIDVGPLSASAMLESLAQLWVHCAYVRGMGTGVAWKLLRR